MKTLICLLATVCGCNATFLSLLNGKLDGHAGSYSSRDHGQAHNYYHYQGHSPEVIKVILDQRNGGDHVAAGGYSYASGYSYGSPTPVHMDHTYSASNNPSYATNSFNSFSSQFSAILPQILELILEDNAGYTSIYGAGSDLSSQLEAHFGNSGIAYITRSNGKGNSYYSGGHVVQKGVLHIARVEGAPVHSAPMHGPSTHVFSSHGPPVHGW